MLCVRFFLIKTFMEIVMLNTYPDKGALRVEKAKQALTMRKNHMFSE